MSDPSPNPDPPRDDEPRPEAAPAPASPGWVTRLVAALLLLGVAGAVVAYTLGGGGAPQPEAPTPAERPPTPVKVLVVAREDVAIQPRFLGQTGASHVVEVRSQVSGTLTQRSFREGEPVAAGQRLFQIDPRPIQLEINEGRARLAAAEARRDRATQQLARFEQLRAKRAATSGDVEEWEKEQRVAAAEVELQKAQVASAELNLDYASIEAPLSGVIGEARLDVGAYVGAATSPLAVIQQVDPIYVRYALTERDLLQLERLQTPAGGGRPDLSALELEVTLSDGRVHPQRGHIDFVEPSLSASTATTTVRGVIPNPDGSLRPGQFVHVTVLGLKREGVIRVPQAAVLHSPAGASVYVVGEGEAVQARPVELGGWLGQGAWEVVGGLEVGDRVITDRLLTLRPGAPVAPQEVSLEDACRVGGRP